MLNRLCVMIICKEVFDKCEMIRHDCSTCVGNDMVKKVSDILLEIELGGMIKTNLIQSTFVVMEGIDTCVEQITKSEQSLYDVELYINELTKIRSFDNSYDLIAYTVNNIILLQNSIRADLNEVVTKRGLYVRARNLLNIELRKDLV